MSDSQSIRDVYKRTLEQAPSGYASYRWGSRSHQRKRFEILEELLPWGRETFSLLDVGCGRGELFKHLRKTRTFTYMGVDVLPEFIEDASHDLPKISFHCANFVTWKVPRRFGYIIASGAVSVRVKDNERYIRTFIRKLHRYAQSGYGFNFLTKSRKDKQRHWYYYDPGDVLNFVLSLSGATSVQVHSGYDPQEPLGDATILVRKS